jgi:hypothetical protein
VGEYDDILVKKPIRTKGEVKPGSHYNDRDNDRGLKYGRSRDAGDASPEVQRQVIAALKAAGKEAGLTSHDIDVVVSIVRYESGFNPDAANKSGSAAGLGSFKDDTRTQYKVKDIFDIETNAKAIVECYKDRKAKAREHRPTGSQEELDRWTYGFYHDGPKGKDHGGKEIFSRPNGVKDWIGPVERSLRTPKGSANPRPSGYLEDPARSFAATRPTAAPLVMDHAGRPNPLGPMPPTWEPSAPATGENSVRPSAYAGPAERPNPLGPLPPNSEPSALPIGPSTGSPLSAFTYLDPDGRPNPLGPLPPTWEPGALPTGENRLALDSPLSGLPPWANPPFQYSPGNVTGLFPAEQPGAAAPAPMGYPSWLPPSDSPLFPHRNVFEPARSVSPWGQPQPGGNNSPAPSPRNAFGPWLGSYPDGPQDLPQSGSRNVFGPWPGSDLPGGSNLLDPDLMELLERYLSR